MIKSENEWRRFVLRALVLSAMVMVASFVGNRLASARDGVERGAARSFLTVTGTLTGVTGPQMATFRFYRAMVGGEPECSPVQTITPRDGMFSEDVQLDQPDVAGAPRRRCPDTLFDGRDVYVDVLIGGEPVVSRRPINPVPYAHYASVAGQYGTPDCPVGYERNPATPSGRMYCRRARADGNYDEIVRVGTGSSAFWIDRYEALVCDSREGVCTALINVRSESDLASRGLPRNGQWGGQNPPLFAISIAASNPPARWVTWYQAEELCRASGKRLPTGVEWLAAARGTGGATGDVGCQISATDPRDITAGAACVSDWGAQDMVGNLWEWTSELYAAPGDTNGALNDQPRTPDAGVMDPWSQRSLYGDDRTTNITSSVATRLGGGGDVLRGMPSAPIRGGGWSAGPRGGKFAMDLNYGPSVWTPDIGFRCVIPR